MATCDLKKKDKGNEKMNEIRNGMEWKERTQLDTRSTTSFVVFWGCRAAQQSQISWYYGSGAMGNLLHSFRPGSTTDSSTS
mmetsp:Transcript_39555/g.95570  ORF Transcript_39555/g.95570 Transcript_39555/m.95570 type:complete len:81 (+) Transcript_39555:429-671(+)